jgi:hypothetical protein
MNRAWYVAGVAALLAGVAVGWYVLRPLPRPAVVEPQSGYLIYDSTAASTQTSGLVARPDSAATPASAEPSSKDVMLDTPAAGSLVVSPLWVVGRARGSWYFEAEFPIRLLDANDTLVTWSSGRARGEWTTQDYVPFATMLNFSTPATETGTLVLERSNPSGLPEHAAEIRIPIRFR